MSNKNKSKLTQRRTVGNTLPIEEKRSFEVAKPNSFAPIVSPEEAVAIKDFMDKNKIKSVFDLSQFNLDKPIVDAEEEQVIKDFYLREQNKNAWIQTFSGRKFFPLNPYIDAIVIQDIAHALSMLCRFTGHCKYFYSVAQHCVMVSYLCDTSDQLYGLLHDASEAYLVDIPTPIKRTPDFAFYKKAEHHLQSMIYKRFGLSEEEPASVKRADTLMLATEATSLLPNLHSEWKLPCNPLPVSINPLGPVEAEQLFLNRFNELFASKAA